MSLPRNVATPVMCNIILNVDFECLEQNTGFIVIWPGGLLQNPLGDTFPSSAAAPMSADAELAGSGGGIHNAAHHHHHSNHQLLSELTALSLLGGCTGGGGGGGTPTIQQPQPPPGLQMHHQPPPQANGAAGGLGSTLHPNSTGKIQMTFYLIVI